MNAEDTTHTSRVPPLPELAKTTAVRRLSDALVARGHHQHSARAIAFAVCDPAAARRQLDEPGRLRVDGGFLEVIQTSVWTPALIPYPVNPRASTTYSYPTEARRDRRAPLPDLQPSSDAAACELVIPAMPMADLIGALDAQTEYLRSTNDLKDSVGRLGIREPLLLLPLVVTSETMPEDAPADVAVLSTVDGSSRLTAAYTHLGVEPSEVLTRNAGNERGLRQRVATFLSIADRPATALADEDMAALRVIVSPATIIVGFVADDARDDTLAEAISSRLGTLHVDPPRPWSSSSRLDVQLDVALRALEQAGKVEPDEIAWLGGRLDTDAQEAAGFRPYQDVRAACLLQQLGGQDSITSQALRTLTSRSRITAQLRAELVAEGALRGFRSSMSEAQTTSARTLLAAIYQMDELHSGWSMDPRTSPGNRDKVLRNALQELEIIGGPGPASREILALASYWLARYRVVARQTRGGQDDRRDITTVLSIMVNSEHGLRQLMAVIKDGRANKHPRRVDPAGKVVLSSLGESIDLDAKWIRETWKTEGEPDSEPDRDELSPEAELTVRQTQLTLQIKTATESLEKLNDPLTEEGTPLVETLGLPTEYVNTLLLELNRMQERLLLLRMLGSRRNPDESAST